MDNTARRWMFDITAWSTGLLAGTGLFAHEAMGEAKLAAPPNERWRAECGSCHIAYSPQLLPAPSWRRIMSQLGQHFGTDATVDAAAAAEIGAYLERYSGSARRTTLSPDSLRITETRWFLHEHAEVPAAVWKLPAVKSPVNCTACHMNAEQGDFRERNIRIPR